MALALLPAAVQAQDALGLPAPGFTGLDTAPEAAMRLRVAAAFPDPWRVRFRKVRPLPTEAGQEAAFCGQVSGHAADGAEQNFHLFLYSRSVGEESVRILGSEALNGYRVGRKLISALRRVGCL